MGLYEPVKLFQVSIQVKIFPPFLVHVLSLFLSLSLSLSLFVDAALQLLISGVMSSSLILFSFIMNGITGPFYESIVNCSQKLFVANILILFVFYAIFCLADFSSEPFDFRLQKRDRGSPEVTKPWLAADEARCSPFV